MSALETFAMFAGLGVMATGIGFAVFLINKSRQIRVNIDTSANPASVGQDPYESLNQRMAQRGFSRNPLWSYESKTTTTYEPRSPKGDITTDPPKPEHTTTPKEDI